MAVDPLSFDSASDDQQIEAVKQAGRAAFDTAVDALVLDVVRDDVEEDGSTGARTRVVHFARDRWSASLSARIDEGTPLTVRLSIQPPAAADIEARHPGGSVRTRTDEAGSVTVTDIDPGPFSAVIEISGDAPRRTATSWVSLRNSV